MDRNSTKNQQEVMPKYVSPSKAAEEFGISRTCFKNRIKNGEMKGLRFLKIGKIIRYEYASIEEIRQKRFQNECQ